MRYVIITDHIVEELYGKQLGIPIFSFPAGEASKTRATKEHLENQLLSHGYSRDTCIIALGGGVVTDLAGFLAATFCRGVDLVLIPTTLLAMVDASIGGKNGVNTDHGKNMIGTFYTPKKIVLNLDFLSTLPQKEWLNGQVEIVKHALIADAQLFHTLPDLSLDTTIQRAIEIKRRIVSRDPYETGLRRTLNVGHTIGHALEAATNYSLSHGEAIALGINIECRIGAALGIFPATSLDLISAQLPHRPLPCLPDTLMQFLPIDKKSRHGLPRFALLQDIGIPLQCEGEYCREVPLEIITQVLHDFALCSC